MTSRMKLVLVVACMALGAGTLGLAEIAAAQTETVQVYVGKGTVLHRSGATLILDVTEGPRGPGIRKFTLKSTDGLMLKDRLGNAIEVFALRKGDIISAYRLESRPAPVTITMSEVEEIKAAEPAVAPRPAPAPAASAPAATASEPAPVALPKTGSPLPLILLLGVLSLTLGLALRAARGRA